MKRRSVIVLVIAIIAVATIIATLISLQNDHSEIQRPLPEVKTILEKYGITSVETSEFYHHTGFSQSPIYIKFATPEAFAEFCLSKNVTTVMHWYGNMFQGAMNYDYFYFVEGTTVYRFINE